MFELPLPKRSAFEVRKVRGREKFQPPERAPLARPGAGHQGSQSRWVRQACEAGERRVRRRELRGGFGELAVKAIAQAYTGGNLPPLLGSGR